jgi:hypothetical protein
MEYTYNVYQILRNHEVDEARRLDELDALNPQKRGRPRKLSRVKSEPDYVKILSHLSGNQIVDLVCKGKVSPKYIQNWSIFSDLDKVRIIVKHPYMFFDFRVPYFSKLSTVAVTYLISKNVSFVRYLHTLDKLSVAEWEYILKKRPLLIEDCPCREQLSQEIKAYILSKYDMAYKALNLQKNHLASQTQLVREKTVKYSHNRLSSDYPICA